MTEYGELFSEWFALADIYDGFTLEDIKSMSRRERKTWLDVAKMRQERSYTIG